MKQKTQNLLHISLGIYGLFILSAVGFYFLSFPIPEWQEKITSLILVTLLIISLIGLGRGGIKYFGSNKIKKEFLSELPEFQLLVCFALGFGACALLVFLVGTLSNGNLQTNLWFIVALLILGLIVETLFWREKKPFNLPKSNRSIPISHLLILSPGVLGLLLSFFACFSPITYYDSLVYHLGLPALHLINGGMGAVEFNLYSYFPSNAEMIFMLVLGKFPSPESVINLLGWFFAFGIGWAIYRWGNEWKGPSTAAWGFTIWWTTPTVLFLSMGAYIDIPLAFLFFIGVRLLAQYTKNKNHTWIILAGIIGGIAGGVKYTGGIFTIIGVIYIFWMNRTNLKQALGHTFIFGSLALLTVSPWLIRNAIQVGNPVFPFAYDIFGGNVGWNGETAQRYFQLLAEYGTKSQVLGEIFLAPFLLLTDPMRYGGGFDVLGDFGWTIPLFVFPLVPIFFYKDKLTMSVFAYAIIHGLIWYLTRPVFRFLVPALPIFVFLAGGVISQIKRQKKIGLGVIGLTTLLIISNLFLFITLSSDLGLFTVSSGAKDREAFLNEKLAFYSTFQEINHQRGPDEKVFLLAEQRGYHLKVPYFTSNFFAESPLARISNAPENSAEDINQYFLENGFTKLLINGPELKRMGGWDYFGFNPQGTQKFLDFLSKKPQITQEKGVFLYNLISPNLKN